LQRALLGAITPQIRVIDTCWDDEKIMIRIVVDSEDPSLMDLANDIEAEVEGDFLPGAQVRVSVEKISAAMNVGEFRPFDGHLARVFARREV
jgi:hypothetical protein